MRLRELLGKLAKPAVNGVFETDGVDDTREVIVQVFEGRVQSPFASDEMVAQYSYHKVKTAGMLFFDGEYKIVIAAYPYDGESDEG
jgi:hypothetical protein